MDRKVEYQLAFFKLLEELRNTKEPWDEEDILEHYYSYRTVEELLKGEQAESVAELVDRLDDNGDGYTTHADLIKQQFVARKVKELDEQFKDVPGKINSTDLSVILGFDVAISETSICW